MMSGFLDLIEVRIALKSVALLFDYQSDWVTDIQPQGMGFSALRAAFEARTSLKQARGDVK